MSINPSWLNPSWLCLLIAVSAFTAPDCSAYDTAMYSEDEIERLKNINTKAIKPYSEFTTYNRIVDIALRNQLTDEMQEAVRVIDTIASQNTGEHSNSYCPDLARTAEKLGNHKYYEEAVSVMCNAIRLQTNGDSYYSDCRFW